MNLKASGKYWLCREPGEDVAAYRKRRAVNQRILKDHLRGRVIHESTRYFHLPESNAEFIQLAVTGKALDVRHWVTEKGEKMVTFRLKGATCRDPARPEFMPRPEYRRQYFQGLQMAKGLA